ncbi:P22 phage major capsid protein family protein [Streptomyces noursei]|uniref:P22 phage major capsid protein family protein n=1 Tax=Streptomyces noursei TaxID=1971 RepID=UPI000C9B0F22|nr:P22 phage major capsid protein family protein [Streptomyces noursei]
MANAFEIDEVASTALGLLSHQAVLGATVYRDAEAEFIGGRGSIVGVRLPKQRTAKDYSGTTEYVDVEEGIAHVKLTDEPTDAAKLGTRDMSLDIRDFGAQVLMPQLDSVSRYIEKNLAGLMNTQSASADSVVIDPAAPLKAIAAASAEFVRREIEPGDRFLAVGPDVYGALLDVEQLQRVDASGDDSMLSRAEIGTLFGFRVIVSPHLTGATAYHKTAFALANRAPNANEGAGKSSSKTFNGYAIRATIDYSADVKSDVSIVDSLCGSSILDPNRMIPFKLKGNQK